jgi:ribonuclease Z
MLVVRSGSGRVARATVTAGAVHPRAVGEAPGPDDRGHRVARLHLLGTGAALSDALRTTTMLAFETSDDVLLVDCGGDVVQRLLAHGIDLDRIGALVVTHEHADHVSGFPLLMERLWLSGRRRPLTVYGIAPAIAQARRAHDAFDTASWPEYPGATYVEVAQDPGATVLESDHWRVTAAPGIHSVPSVGLRVEDRHAGGVAAYSGDTSFAAAIVDLARGADILVHEASDEPVMHSRPSDAARAALEAGAKRLVLVHLPPGFAGDDGRADEARAIFPDVTVGEDGATFEF